MARSTREFATGTSVTQAFPWGTYVSAKALCPDGKVRTVSRISETADTWSTVPASVVVCRSGQRLTVAGFITMATKSGLSTPTPEDPAIVYFYPYSKCRNARAFDKPAKPPRPSDHGTIARTLPRLVRAMRWQGVLTDAEAISSLSMYRQGDAYGSEAVSHYGGTARLVRDALAARQTSRVIQGTSLALAKAYLRSRGHHHVASMGNGCDHVVGRELADWCPTFVRDEWRVVGQASMPAGIALALYSGTLWPVLPQSHPLARSARMTFPSAIREAQRRGYSHAHVFVPGRSHRVVVPLWRFDPRVAPGIEQELIWYVSGSAIGIPCGWWDLITKDQAAELCGGIAP